MSDVSGGSGWWQASDGKWYRPEQHPDYTPPPPPPPAPPPPPPPSQPPPTAPPPRFVSSPPQAAPPPPTQMMPFSGQPTVQMPMTGAGQLPPGYGPLPPSPPSQPPPKRPLYRAWWFWLIVGFVVLIIIGGVVGGGKKKLAKNTLATTTTTLATTSKSPPTTAAQTTTPPTTSPPTTSPPAVSQAQIVQKYEATAQNVPVSDLAKDPSQYNGKTVTVTATIYDFLQDSSGNTTAMNVQDPNDPSSDLYVQLSNSANVTKMNKGDTIVIWGDGAGVVSATNAFGGAINEATVSEVYLSDQTTGYNDNTDPSPS